MRAACAVIVGLIVAACAAAPPAAQRAPTTAQRVDEAVQQGVGFLYASAAGADWDGGLLRGALMRADLGEGTSAAILALLSAGENAQDPRIANALRDLLLVQSPSTLTAALRAQICAQQMPARDARAAAVQDVAFLLGSTAKTGPAAGLVGRAGPLAPNQPVNPDAYATAEATVTMDIWDPRMEIPQQFSEAAERSLTKAQAKGGGWSDGLGANVQPALPASAAAMCALLTLDNRLRAFTAIDCRGNVPQPADESLKWIGAHIKDPLDFRGWYYLGRVGLLTGQRRFGGVDWRQRGIDELLAAQKQDGGWGVGAASNVMDTAYAVRFLAQAQQRQIISKLVYQANGREGGWNERPRDVANVTRFISDVFTCGTQEWNWRTVSLDDPLEDLSESPILFVAGREALQFTPEQEQKLRRFVEAGGIVVGNSDCVTKAFADSFTKLGTKLFGYDFRELPKDHVLYTRQQFPRVTWKDPPRVQGMSNGVRELMILLQDDLAKAWQREQRKTRHEHFEVMVDIYDYARHRDNRRNSGGLPPTIPLEPQNKPAQTIRLARLQYSGNWDPEPEGWRRLGVWMRNNYATDLAVTAVKLGAGKLAGLGVAHLTGTGKLSLAPAEEEELTQFVQGGGTLIIDAAGGDKEFADSAAAEVAKLWPKQPLAALGADDAMYREALAAGVEVYRTYAKSAGVGVRQPLVQAVVLGGRNAVVFSAPDISAGLTAADFDGIAGYTPRFGTELMSGILLRATGK